MIGVVSTRSEVLGSPRQERGTKPVRCALVWSVLQRVFMSPLLSESTSTFQYGNKRRDKPLLILFIFLSLPLALSLFTLCH